MRQQKTDVLTKERETLGYVGFRAPASTSVSLASTRKPFLSKPCVSAASRTVTRAKQPIKRKIAATPEVVKKHQRPADFGFTGISGRPPAKRMTVGAKPAAPTATVGRTTTFKLKGSSSTEDFGRVRPSYETKRRLRSPEHCTVRVANTRRRDRDRKLGTGAQMFRSLFEKSGSDSDSAFERPTFSPKDVRRPSRRSPSPKHHSWVELHYPDPDSERERSPGPLAYLNDELELHPGNRNDRERYFESGSTQYQPRWSNSRPLAVDRS